MRKQVWKALSAGILVAAIAATTSVSAESRRGVTYRLGSGDAVQVVRVAAGDARMEFEVPEDDPRAGRVEIWKAAEGKHFVLRRDRTYHDEVAYSAARKKATRWPTVRALNVSETFQIEGVRKLRVEVGAAADVAEDAGRPACRRVPFTLSYDLKLRLKVVPGSFPANVEGRGELCLADPPFGLALPFGHGAHVVSGIDEVDAVVAERLGSLPGIPVEWSLTVTRQIEGGESVTEEARRVIRDFTEADLPSALFEVPAGYRYQEPVIVGPVRQTQ